MDVATKEVEEEVKETETETEVDEANAEVEEEQKEEPTETDEEGKEVEVAEDEVIVSIGDEVPEEEEIEKGSSPIKDLRRANRAHLKEIKSLKQQLKPALVPTTELGEKPTLAGSNYDSVQFENDLDKWKDRKRNYDKEQAEAKEVKEGQAKAWQGTLDAYGEKKGSLKVDDFEDIEAIAQDALSNTQQAIILQGAKNPAVVIYGLGKNPKRLSELTEIKDPVKFAMEVARLEVTMKVTKVKATTKPETKVSGNGQVSGSNSTLEALREKAEKTGDLSEVIAYNRQMKDQNK